MPWASTDFASRIVIVKTRQDLPYGGSLFDRIADQIIQLPAYCNSRWNILRAEAQAPIFVPLRNPPIYLLSQETMPALFSETVANI